MAAELTRWLPELFDADALANVPEGVAVDYLLPAEEDAALDAWLDAYAVAVANDDAEGVAALRAMMAEALAEAGGSLSHATESLAALARAIEIVRAEGDPASEAELQAGWVYEAWQAAPLLWGKSGAKAVWSGPGKKRPIYGERARKALERAKAAADKEQADAAAKKAAGVDYKHRDPSHPVARAIAADTETAARVKDFLARAESIPEPPSWEAVKAARAAADEAQRKALAARRGRGKPEYKARRKAIADELAKAASDLEFARYQAQRSDASEARRQAGRKVLAEVFGLPPGERRVMRDDPSKDALFDDERPLSSDERRTFEAVAGHLGTFLRDTGSSLDMRWRIDTSMPGGGWCYGTKVVVSNPRERHRDEEVARVAAHEMGHAVENTALGLRQEAQEFLAYRAGGEAAVTLPKADQFGDKIDTFLDAWERTDPATGGRFGTDYTGRRYGSGSTEIVSVGCEHLMNDPVAFARSDPEYFAWLMSALRKKR